MNETDAALCAGCDRPLDNPVVGTVEIWSGIKDEGTSILTYCSPCGEKIRSSIDNLSDDLHVAIRNRLGKPVSISEDLVREIAKNLGASEKLTNALVECCFGEHWDGKVPAGARMNQYQNRDRLVVFVAMKLQSLWKFEA